MTATQSGVLSTAGLRRVLAVLSVLEGHPPVFAVLALLAALAAGLIALSAVKR